MLGLFKRYSLKMLKGIIIAQLMKPEVRSKISTAINKKFDIKKLTEEEEQKFIRAIIDAACEYVV